VRFYWLALGILAVWRLTHLLNAEDGPWELVARFRKRMGSNVWGKWLDCFYCLSLWMAIPFALLLAEGWRERLILWPALSGGSILAERLTAQEQGAQYVEDRENPLLRENTAATTEHDPAATRARLDRD
jgi:hypothetical protein